jgi:hypothetical protein
LGYRVDNFDLLPETGELRGEGLQPGLCAADFRGKVLSQDEKSHGYMQGELQDTE